jgi:hypothetical protein
MLAINVTDRENYLAREIQENSIKCTESEQKAARLAQGTFFQQHSRFHPGGKLLCVDLMQLHVEQRKRRIMKT